MFLYCQQLSIACLHVSSHADNYFELFSRSFTNKPPLSEVKSFQNHLILNDLCITLIDKCQRKKRILVFMTTFKMQIMVFPKQLQCITSIIISRKWGRPVFREPGKGREVSATPQRWWVIVTDNQVSGSNQHCPRWFASGLISKGDPFLDDEAISGWRLDLSFVFTSISFWCPLSSYNHESISVETLHFT